MFFLPLALLFLKATQLLFVPDPCGLSRFNGSPRVVLSLELEGQGDGAEVSNERAKALFEPLPLAVLPPAPNAKSFDVGELQ